MPAGKPFPKVSDAQRAAFTEAAKRDGVRLLQDLGRAAVEHLAQNPDSVVTQTVVAVERDTGAVTVLTRGIQALLRERAAAKSTARPGVVDAEFVDE